MLRPAADHRVHQDYISDHLELTGERKEEEEEFFLLVIAMLREQTDKVRKSEKARS